MRDSGMILQLLSRPTLPPSRHHQSSTRITTFSSLMDTLRSSRVRTIPSSFGTKRSHVFPGPNIAPERAICRKRAPWRNRGWNLVLRSTHTGSMRIVPFSYAMTMGRRIALWLLVRCVNGQGSSGSSGECDDPDLSWIQELPSNASYVFRPFSQFLGHPVRRFHQWNRSTSLHGGQFGDGLGQQHVLSRHSAHQKPQVVREKDICGDDVLTLLY